MAAMATLHVRNVPTELYEALRKRSALNGRSINAEVIDILDRGVERWRQDEHWLERFEALRGRMKLPPGAPKPEDLIRWDRDHGH
jgi:plasmid stability protein